MNSFRMLAVAALAATALCWAGDLERQVQGLRPADTSAGEKAVLDDVQQRAATALTAIQHARTPTAADSARPKLRERLKESLGFGLLPWPPRLNARSVGTITREGYRIEKIVFESLPDVPLAAHLYLPAVQAGRAPGVLFYVGHWWPDAKSRPDFQAFCINMARLGFVVLAWDPFGQGERGISSRDHRRTEMLLVGVSQQGLAEYETRCALEYLLSRNEVDPQRIGITGASGGGYNTWITAALDDRIKVAVPVVGTSEFYEQISVTRPLDWYHASEHCHFVPGLIRYANNHEFLAMVAPRPLMIIAASKDQSFPIGGVKEVAAYGTELYRAYGMGERIGFYEDTEEGHGYQKRKREAAYGWFLRWLMKRGNGEPFAEPETTPAPYDAAEMRCFAPGKNRAAGPGIIEQVRRLAANKDRNTSVEEVLGSHREALGGWPKVTDDAVQRLVIRSRSGFALPAFLLRPKGRVRGVLLAADDRGKEAVLPDLPVDEMLRGGWAVLGVDPRGLGELKTAQMGWVAAVSLLLNENFVGLQAMDITRAADVARSAFPGARIGLYARGDNACLAAAYSIAGLSFFVLEDGFVTFRDFFNRPRSMQASFELKKDDRDRTTAFDREIPFAYFPFGALQSFDIPDLLAAGNVPGLVVNPVNGDWERADVAVCRKLLPNNVRVTSTRQDLREFLR